MRLLLVSAFPPNPQGEANYAGQYLGALRALAPDWEYHVVAQRFETEKGAEIFPGVTRLMRRSGFTRHLNAFRILGAVLRIRPDVIHLQSPVIPDYGGKFGEPMLVALALIRLLGVKVVITLHSTWMEEDLADLAQQKGLSPRLGRLFVGYYKSVLRNFARVSHGFMILTAGEQSPAAERFCKDFGITSDKVRNEPHPCPATGSARQRAAQALANLGLDGARLVSAFGFMREDKGFHFLIEAMQAVMQRHPGTVLLLAGRAQRPMDSAYVTRLKEECARSLDPSRVRFMDRYLTDQEMNDILDGTEILVVPYLRALGASGPAHHAIGRHKAVVVSAIGQNLGLAGICRVVPPGDSESLRVALSELLSNADELRRWESAAGTYADTHTWFHMAQSYRLYFESLVRDGRRARFQFLTGDRATMG